MGGGYAAPLGILTPAGTAWEALVQQLCPPWGNPTLTLLPFSGPFSGPPLGSAAILLQHLCPPGTAVPGFQHDHLPVSPKGL